MQSLDVSNHPAQNKCYREQLNKTITKTRSDGVVGYRICLTHRRSPVRTRVRSFFFYVVVSLEVGWQMVLSNGSGRSSAEWDLDVAVYPPPGKRVFDGARERRLGSATMTSVC